MTTRDCDLLIRAGRPFCAATGLNAPDAVAGQARGPGRLRTFLLVLMTATAVAFAAIVSTACADDTAPGSDSAPAPSATPAAPPASTSATGAPAADATGSVAAAQAFLSALTAEQRAAAVLALDDPARANWSNLPAGVVRFEHNGVRIGDLNAAQTAAMHRFLSAALSADGYATVGGVIGAEAVLAQSPNAARLQWSADNYWLAFFGAPSADKQWAWQFGGHHLAVNVTVVAGRSYLSPTFVGIEPASYTSGEFTVAPLDAQLQAGLALINALDDKTRALASVTNRPREVWAGAGKDGVIPPLEGAKVADWSAAQRQLLLDTITLWVGILDAPSSQARLAEIRADLGNTYFAWHGPVDGSGSIYYRIQGTNLIIEFSTQGNLGSDRGHYHSIYRNPPNEYGRGV